MTDKINTLLLQVEQADIIIAQSIGAETTSNPQRFASFVVALRDFKENPIFGYGGHTEGMYVNQIGANLSTISGIGNLLAKFGLIGFLFFIIVTISTSWLFSNSFNYKGGTLFFLIIIFSSISYGLFLIPLFMSFWMFSFYEKNFEKDTRGGENS
ncbi:MAG: hypothetical protein ACFFKA_06660 [Candidatus Thorarchaeota archaeon]